MSALGNVLGVATSLQQPAEDDLRDCRECVEWITCKQWDTANKQALPHQTNGDT